MDSPALCPSGIGRGNLNPQASSGASHPPSHGLKAESVPSMKPEEKTRPICPLSLKWQIGLGLWQKVARRETERSAASAKRAAATHRGIPKGAALGAPLVTFPATGKSPGVGGAERPPLGAVGAPAPTSGSAEGRSPSQNREVTRGRRGGAPSPRGRGGPSPHFGERRGGHRRCSPSQKRV